MEVSKSGVGDWVSEVVGVSEEVGVSEVVGLMGRKTREVEPGRERWG